MLSRLNHMMIQKLYGLIRVEKSIKYEANQHAKIDSLLKVKRLVVNSNKISKTVKPLFANKTN